MRGFLRKFSYYMYYYAIFSFLGIGEKREFYVYYSCSIFSTIAQPFPIFKKLLTIIPSMQKHPH